MNQSAERNNKTTENKSTDIANRKIPSHPINEGDTHDRHDGQDPTTDSNTRVLSSSLCCVLFCHFYLSAFCLAFRIRDGVDVLCCICHFYISVFCLAFRIHDAVCLFGCVSLSHSLTHLVKTNELIQTQIQFVQTKEQNALL